MRRSIFACVLGAALLGLLPATGSARTLDVWIAAVPVTWDVVPNGRDAIGGTTFTKDQTVFRTVVYRAYTRNWGPTNISLAESVDAQGIRAAVGQEREAGLNPVLDRKPASGAAQGHAGQHTTTSNVTLVKISGGNESRQRCCCNRGRR